MVKMCQDFGDEPACLGIADGRYTMDFTDVEPDGYIYWCAYCGPRAHAMDQALTEALQTRGPEFVVQLAEAVEAEHAKIATPSGCPPGRPRRSAS